MRKPEELSVIYNGYKMPLNTDELEFEILGLELCIADCQKRINLLKQSRKMAEMKNKELLDKQNNDKTI